MTLLKTEEVVRGDRQLALHRYLENRPNPNQRNALFEANLPLAKGWLRRRGSTLPYGIPPEEEGFSFVTHVLLVAIRTYNPNMNAALSTWFYQCLTPTAMYRFLKDDLQGIGLPEYLSAQLNFVQRQEVLFRHAFGRTPYDDAELADFCNMSEAVVRDLRIIQTRLMLVSLGMGEDTSHEGGLPAQITEERLICRDQQPERTEAIHERLYAALNCLTKQEEEILWAKANHGTLRAIAAQHNLTPFTVRKIIDRAILKARRHLNLDPNMEIVWLKA